MDQAWTRHGFCPVLPRFALVKGTGHGFKPVPKSMPGPCTVFAPFCPVHAPFCPGLPFHAQCCPGGALTTVKSPPDQVNDPDRANAMPAGSVGPRRPQPASMDCPCLWGLSAPAAHMHDINV